MVVVVAGRGGGSRGEGTLLTNDLLPVKNYWIVVLIICRLCDISLAHINILKHLLLCYQKKYYDIISYKLLVSH